MITAFSTLLALGVALPVVAASPAPPATASAAPAKASQKKSQKKKTHHVKHVKKAGTSTGAPKTTS